MTGSKAFEKLGNLSLRQCRTYPLVVQNSEGEWVEAQMTVNDKEKRIELTSIKKEVKDGIY